MTTAAHIEPDWQPIETIPIDRLVWIRTARGLVRKGKVSDKTRCIQEATDMRKRSCIYMSTTATTGLVAAVAWKEIVE